MIAEIICVGNELLYGDTLNTNTQYLSRQLTLLGIEVSYQVVVGDHEQDLLKAIELASERADVILFSGGLGPTYDDMTKETVAKAIGQSMVMDESSLKIIQEFFTRMGREMTDSNIKQAYRPENGICLTNNNGTAPGIYVEEKGTHYFCLPGPPGELKPMYQEQVQPRLLKLTKQVITSKLFMLAGIGESTLADMIGHIMDHSVNPRIAPYVKTGALCIRVTARSETEEVGQKLVQGAETALMPYIKPYLYSDEGKELEEVIVEHLTGLGKRISIAESCTGGLISSRITDVSGASQVFSNSFITYSNESKHQWLNVPMQLLETQGAVSEAVASAMAVGVKEVSGTDIGVSVTGIAGPTGGTKEKPVGLVYIGVATEKGIRVVRHQFFGNRQSIRSRSAQYALLAIFEEIKEMMEDA